MSEDNKDDNLKNEDKLSETDNQSEVDKNNTTEEINQSTTEQNNENQPSVENVQSADENSDTNLTEQPENISKEPENKNEHQVIHKKDGRLHIYVRQDKYKGELKSKNWVGRLYIDGKQKISSSGTQNLDEAIPILEKWFDDIHAESERLKKQNEQSQISSNNEEQASLNQEDETKVSSPNETTPAVNPTDIVTQQTSQPVVNQSVENKNEEKNILNNNVNEESKKEPSSTKEKFSNLFGKLKNIKLKKPSLDGIKLPKSPSIKKNNSFTKALDFLKSKIGKSSIQGEEIVGAPTISSPCIEDFPIFDFKKSNAFVKELFFFIDGDLGSFIPSNDGFFNLIFFNLPNKFENFSFVEEGSFLLSSLTLLFKIFFSSFLFSTL